MPKIFNIFNRRKNDRQKKSSSGSVNGLVSPISKESFVDFLLGAGEVEVSNYVINKYYLSCAPLADGIDRVSSAVSNIDPSVWDQESSAFDNDHPVIKLLKKPNMLQTYETFMKRACSLLLLHGEVFFLTSGKINNEPGEVFVVSSQTVTVEVSPIDGYISSFIMQDGVTQATFHRHNINGRFRYYSVPAGSDPKSDLSTKEIMQVQEFNPIGSVIPIRGTSILQSLYYEIEQWISSSKHNLSVLLRGATLSGIVSTDANLQGLTKDQSERLRQKLDNYMSGSSNAGRIALFDNGLKFTSTTQSNKDMDFKDLKRDLKIEIYNRLKIPLPHVNVETMTMANRENAEIAFYDNTVEPITTKLYSELTILIMYRYPDSENKSLMVDPSNIAVLEPRKIERTIKLRAAQIISVNEARGDLDIELFENGGNSVYEPGSNIPVASEDEISQESTSSGENPESFSSDDESEISEETRKIFINLMKCQIDVNGDRKYTDEHIIEIANKKYLK